MKLSNQLRIYSFFVLAFMVASHAQAQLFPLTPFGEEPITQGGIRVSVNSINGVLTVTAPNGTDISTAVGSALAKLANTCGTIVIAPGTYVWSKAGVEMFPCETLSGPGATVMVNVGGANPPFLVVKGPAPPGPDPNRGLTVGNIRGMTFVGPATPTGQDSSMGLELGGTTSAETAQLINLYDVHIRNFGCGVNIRWAFQIAFFGGSIEGNYDGVCFADVITFLENISFHGTQILNNINYGINQNQTGANTELTLVSCSLDYNGQNQTSGGEVQIANGKLNIIGGHFENNNLPMITIPVPGAAAVATVFIEGTSFNIVDTRPTSTYASFIKVQGVNNVVELGRGVSFLSQGAAVSSVVNWEPTVNQNSRLIMDPYTYTVITIPKGLPAYTGVAPNNYFFPTYDIHDNVLGISSSYGQH